MSLEGKIALIKRWGKMAIGKNSVAVKQGAGRCFSKTEISGYYNDLTGKIRPETLLDEQGIPVNEIAGGKTVRFPISIFQYALGLWDLYLLSGSSDNEKRSHFLKLCTWMVEHQQENGAWDCFGPIGYSNQAFSSMGQGEAISALLRAYEITRDETWLCAAQRAIAFMVTPLDNGGTLRIEGNDFIFEEYANTEGDKHGVLNGWIFSLFGVFDYLKVQPDGDIQTVYEKSLQTLQRYLERYDTGYWSRYDLTGRLASPAYHDLHVCLLEVMWEITGNSEFRDTASHWKKYQHQPGNRTRAIIGKVFQKLGENSEGILIK